MSNFGEQLSVVSGDISPVVVVLLSSWYIFVGGCLCVVCKHENPYDSGVHAFAMTID